MKVYPNTTVEYGFNDSLLQVADIELSDDFVAEFNATKAKWTSMQKTIEDLYFEALGVEVVRD